MDPQSQFGPTPAYPARGHGGPGQRRLHRHQERRYRCRRWGPPPLRWRLDYATAPAGARQCGDDHPAELGGWAAEVTPATVRLAVDRAQVNTLPEYRPDRAIAEAVLAALRAHPRFRRVLRGIISFAPALSHPRWEWAIRVRVAQGIVTLEGHVPAHGFGNMAAQIASRVPGVRQVRAVANQLRRAI